MDGSTSKKLEMTADVVAAFVANNPLRTSDVPELISSVYKALVQLAASPQVEERPEPPVSIKKSITPDYLISLEDGRGYKSLKRHLTGRGITPEQYRAKWGLPVDYPMVAPNYAKRRSELAKSLGLGQLRRRQDAAEGQISSDISPEQKTPKRRGRRPLATASAAS